MKSKSGFTIVELLIVIIVIAILAAISIVSYKGIQDRAYATQYLSAIDTYEKALLQYKMINGVYPTASDLPTGTPFACLGGPFPASSPFAADECYHLDDRVVARSSATLDSAISTIIKPLPTATKKLTYQDGSEVAWLRGILYVGGSASASLLYMVSGDQTCGRGGKIPLSTNGSLITYCIVSLR